MGQTQNEWEIQFLNILLQRFGNIRNIDGMLEKQLYSNSYTLVNISSDIPLMFKKLEKYTCYGF